MDVSVLFLFVYILSVVPGGFRVIDSSSLGYSWIAGEVQIGIGDCDLCSVFFRLQDTAVLRPAHLRQSTVTILGRMSGNAHEGDTRSLANTSAGGPRATGSYRESRRRRWCYGIGYVSSFASSL